LREIVAHIDPFPPFPSAMFAYGIEVPPPAAADAGVGCVILGNDGELYELRIGIDADQLARGADHLGARHEELLRLELPPAEIAAYARAALEVATAHLGSRESPDSA
jgi:hypothetical protein